MDGDAPPTARRRRPRSQALCARRRRRSGRRDRSPGRDVAGLSADDRRAVEVASPFSSSAPSAPGRRHRPSAPPEPSPNSVGPCRSWRAPARHKRRSRAGRLPGRHAPRPSRRGRARHGGPPRGRLCWRLGLPSRTPRWRSPAGPSGRAPTPPRSPRSQRRPATASGRRRTDPTPRRASRRPARRAAPPMTKP